MLAIAGGVAGLFVWLVSEPFVATVAPGSVFSVGSFYGWFAHLLLGAFIAGSLALVVSKNRTDWPKAVIACAIAAALGGISVCTIDAVSDFIWVQIEAGTWLARGETMVPSFFWNLAIAFALAMSVSVATQPTPARYKRAMLGGLAAGLVAFFLRISLGGTLEGIVQTSRLDYSHLEESVRALQRWRPYNFERLFDFVGLGSALGLVLGIGDTVVRHAWVRVMLPSNETRDFPMEEGPNRIGSQEGIEVPLFGDSRITAVHATIERHKDGYYLTDMGSPGGTELNRQPVRQSPLKDGDEVHIGRTYMQFRQRRAPEYYDPKQPFEENAATAPIPVTPPDHRLVDPFGNVTNLPFGLTIIGRGPSVTIDASFDRKVAPRHTQILSDATSAVISDLGSLAGTMVNGNLIQGNLTLCDGDKLKVGDTVFLYRR